jgi:hypothetical protein
MRNKPAGKILDPPYPTKIMVQSWSTNLAPTANMLFGADEKDDQEPTEPHCCEKCGKQMNQGTVEGVTTGVVDSIGCVKG